jgi:probable 2-oxoglutarate dehydrogenase E1 component DHKTD1
LFLYDHSPCLFPALAISTSFVATNVLLFIIGVSIGYTTPASNAHSSLYCSDIGKIINAPVLHVNGDHPEGDSKFLLLGYGADRSQKDVVKAMDIAFRYRNYFKKDIVVDLLVYRTW